MLKKTKQAVNKSKLEQREEAIKMDLLSAYIDADLTGLDKPSDETIKDIVENNGGTIDESDPNIIHTPDGDIKLDDILNESSSSSQNPEDINKTVEELNNQINDLKSQLAEEESKREGLETQIGELQIEVESWKKKAEDGEVTIAEKDAEISDLKNQITAKNEELDNKNNEINELNNNITTLTGQKETLETQIANLQKKQATGNATASDVLAGKTFSNSSSIGLTGTMVNRGTLNFNPSSSMSQTVQPGYYSGGTLSTSNAYNAALKSSSVKYVSTEIRQGANTVGFTIAKPADFNSAVALVSKSAFWLR